MLKTLVMEFYKENYGVVTKTGQLYEYFEELMGDYVDEDFKHILRCYQQLLKSEGLIEHPGYNKWLMAA